MGGAVKKATSSIGGALGTVAGTASPLGLAGGFLGGNIGSSVDESLGLTDSLFGQPDHPGADTYRFHDPAGQFERATDTAQSMQQFGRDQTMAMMEPGAFMSRFQQDAEGMASLAQGAVSPLQQQLNALASEQAQRGLDMASTEMSGLGALHSGAAQRAMGQAMATPFAEAQADIGRQQVGLTGQLMQQAGQRQDLEAQLAHQLWGQGTQQMGQLGMHASAMEAPIYHEETTGGQRFGAGLQGAMGGAAAGAPLGPWGMAGGAALGGLGGIFSA